MKKIPIYSSFARPIDLRYQSNIYVVFITVFTFVASFIFRTYFGSEAIDAVEFSITAGVFVFLSWAIAREIDPAHPMSALIVTFLIFPFIFFFDNQPLAEIFIILILLRIINQSTGHSLSFLESLILGPLFAIFIFIYGIQIAIITIITFAIDAFLRKEKRIIMPVFVFCVLGIIFSFVFGDNPKFILPEIPNMVLGIIALALLPSATKKLAAINTKDDQGQFFQMTRILATHVFLLIVGIIFIFLEMYESVSLVIWLCIISMALTQIIKKRAQGTLLKKIK